MLLNIFGPRQSRSVTDQLSQRYLEQIATLMSQSTVSQRGVSLSDRGRPNTTSPPDSVTSTSSPKPFSPVILTQILSSLVK